VYSCAASTGGGQGSHCMCPECLWYLSDDMAARLQCLSDAVGVHSSLVEKDTEVTKTSWHSTACCWVCLHEYHVLVALSENVYLLHHCKLYMYSVSYCMVWAVIPYTQILYAGSNNPGPVCRACSTGMLPLFMIPSCRVASTPTAISLRICCGCRTLESRDWIGDILQLLWW